MNLRERRLVASAAYRAHTWPSVFPLACRHVHRYGVHCSLSTCHDCPHFAAFPGGRLSWEDYDGDYPAH